MEDAPAIIEYSDQEVPESPGYDTITVTRNATPYREQLGEILTTADLDVAGRTVEARRAANAILDDINVLSGAWALDFLLGSIADTRTSMRLKGNVGATLAYRWLRRIEHGVHGSMILPTNVGSVVPVYVSLEDLLRATPAAGLSRKGGLVYRYTNEVDDGENQEAARWCDDLLVLYLTPTEKGQPSRLFGRVVEVKFGKGALGTREKAVGQVRNTQQLLQERLAGDPKPLDAAFRHKQLSLLIKAQVEQAVAMNVMDSSVYEFLNVPALSANLATGNYSVDYTIAAEGRHLVGDAFLLHTGASGTEQVQVDEQEGVRIITIPRSLVEWLAFDLADSPTLDSEPPSTLPRLGHYQSVGTASGLSRRQMAPSAPVSEPMRVLRASVAVARHQNELLPVAPNAPAASTLHGDANLSSELALDEDPQARLSVAASQRRASVAADPQLGLKAAVERPVKVAPYADEPVVAAISRLERALVGHKVRLASPPSAREADRGPRLLRAHVRLAPGESINAVRRISEDIARVVGTTTSDIHITNVPDRHAIGLDLPMSELSYAVGFDELIGHSSFMAARQELTLGFCAGIDVTGRALWVDLAAMPHMLVAGTTGSGKTVFLRNLILTLLLGKSPVQLKLRLSSSKPMDFRVFAQTEHAADREMAKSPDEARLLSEELVQEMDRRYGLLDAALCDNLAEYNEENPAKQEPYFVAVFDEYAEMVSSFTEKHGRDAFEGAIARLAQKARAAGIHLIVCMQRPDANALKGAIKANIVHRFALKLPQNHDSRIILDEGGAETLLGQGDLLYKDANSRLFRLQVPFLENATLKRCLQQVPIRGIR
ncbi:FtsK/SpoIIIE domain-containing protein [Corallococcus sp. CA049B]|uniref:FtsK/SpoIIIE domain-containing protein n=1 Tax=Corallococcus sp. CA049B TaxID=2316730 RepID=UPI0013157F23|nr:FtsK/SpoIIIE domain-containing protein [Corallococcus sp. CA049B]